MRIIKILKRKDDSNATYVDISFKESDEITKYTYFLNKNNGTIISAGTGGRLKDEYSLVIKQFLKTGDKVHRYR